MSVCSSSSFCGQVQDLVEALSAQLDQLFPPSAVISLSAQTIYLHLLNKIISSQNVKILLRIFFFQLFCPICLSSSWQADHHQGFTLPSAIWRDRTSSDSISKIKLTNWSVTYFTVIFKKLFGIKLRIPFFSFRNAL